MTPRRIMSRAIRLICPRCGRINNVPEADHQRYPTRNCGDCLLTDSEVVAFEPYDPDKHRPPWLAPKRRRA